MNNILVESGQKPYAIQLSRRFAHEVPNTVNFAFNKYYLDAQAQAILRRQADWIRQFPEVRFRVYGYTDLVGSEHYNKTLGLRRAQAVVSYLVSQGISRVAAAGGGLLRRNPAADPDAQSPNGATVAPSPRCRASSRTPRRC